MLIKLLETTLITLCAIVEGFRSPALRVTSPHFLKRHYLVCPQPNRAFLIPAESDSVRADRD